MWIQKIKSSNRSITPVELLVLSNLKEEFLNAPDLIKTLHNKIQHYSPERGTIYPILHRLSAEHLIERNTGKKMEFRRTEIGNTFLVSMTNSLSSQMKSTASFYESIFSSLIDIDSEKAHSIIDDFIKQVKVFLDQLETLKEVAEKDAGEWKEISIE